MITLTRTYFLHAHFYMKIYIELLLQTASAHLIGMCRDFEAVQIFTQIYLIVIN